MCLIASLNESAEGTYVDLNWLRGDIKIPHSRMTKAFWRNVGYLFVICMRQLTKGHLYYLFGVSDYYVMYRQMENSVLWYVSKGP